MKNPEQEVPVYSVAVLDVRDTDCPGYWRTPAVFSRLDLAIQAVRDNEMDISEGGSNQYAIVEKTYLNQVYPQAEERYWFEWNSTEEEYVESQIPPKYALVYSFGIG